MTLKTEYKNSINNGVKEENSATTVKEWTVKFYG